MGGSKSKEEIVIAQTIESNVSVKEFNTTISRTEWMLLNIVLIVMAVIAFFYYKTIYLKIE